VPKLTIQPARVPRITDRHGIPLALTDADIELHEQRQQPGQQQERAGRRSAKEGTVQGAGLDLDR